MATRKKSKTPIRVEALKHDEATRKNIPTAEYQAVLAKDEQASVRMAMERRNRDLDSQLVWRGKVQCTYFEPSHGIKFNSNSQWLTASLDSFNSYRSWGAKL